MQKKKPLAKKDLIDFSNHYDDDKEFQAEQKRGEFLNDFPLTSLKKMTKERYAIGQPRPTFCDSVEFRTRSWAMIQGATADKFGIYFGKRKGSPKVTWQHPTRMGNNFEDAWQNTHNALIDLIENAQHKHPDFAKIDANPLTQMFKAKILSLYFPNKFINICSRDHLHELSSLFSMPEKLPTSEYQHRLINLKMDNEITRYWSNPKFMSFLYENFIRKEVTSTESIANKVTATTSLNHKEVNFDELQEQRNLIGKLAEEFAIEKEKERLKGAGLEHMISKIEDRRSRPGYGHDYLSWSTEDKPRQIEVKAVAKTGADSWRFFLSENEYQRSQESLENEWYFYLVFFDKNGPQALHICNSEEMYKQAEMIPASWSMYFDYHLKK
ncbi:DUF3883 domain-containing protein [Buttiauxella gaviniae]|uniref:DUF3883 domain-containing protein n=1 Tax=Buttiauxella gaviniae TaxID=82990 RepID=UPI003C780969